MRWLFNSCGIELYLCVKTNDISTCWPDEDVFSDSSVCLWHIRHDSIAESIINDSIVYNAERGTAVFFLAFNRLCDSPRSRHLFQLVQDLKKNNKLHVQGDYL